MDKDKQLYEIAYLITPGMNEEDAQNFHQTIKNSTQGFGAILDDEGRVEKKWLRYPINKQKEAYLAYFRFTLEQEKINEVVSVIKSKKEILRHLLIKTKRQIAQKIFSTRPFKTVIKETAKNSARSDSETKREPVEIPAANIEEIDKKLEEILGK